MAAKSKAPLFASASAMWLIHLAAQLVVRLRKLSKQGHLDSMKCMMQVNGGRMFPLHGSFLVVNEIQGGFLKSSPKALHL